MNGQHLRRNRRYLKRNLSLEEDEMECSDHEEEEEEPTESSLKEDSFTEDECTENEVHEPLAGCNRKNSSSVK